MPSCGQQLYLGYEEPGEESTLRDNGSRRDLDLVAMRVLEPGEGPQAESAILSAIDHKMVVSVFGLDARQEPNFSRRILRSALEWTSRRTIDENGIHRYEIYPLEQEILEPELVYEPWLMDLPGGGEISVMPPDTTVTNYDIRSVSPRAKDRAKLTQMRQRILAEPPFVERLHGPLKPVTQLAEAIVALGGGTLGKDSPLLIDGAGMFGRGAFRARAGLNTLGGRSEFLVKLIGHNELMQKGLKGTTGRK